jgi:hypothetical protein
LESKWRWNVAYFGIGEGLIGPVKFCAKMTTIGSPWWYLCGYETGTGFCQIFDSLAYKTKESVDWFPHVFPVTGRFPYGIPVEADV